MATPGDTKETSTNTVLLLGFYRYFWVFWQWASIILVIEQSVTRDARKQQQVSYSMPLADGRRAILIKWHQTVSPYPPPPLDLSPSPPSSPCLIPHPPPPLLLRFMSNFEMLVTSQSKLIHRSMIFIVCYVLLFLYSVYNTD